jgi:hypothetical protein
MTDPIREVLAEIRRPEWVRCVTLDENGQIGSWCGGDEAPFFTGPTHAALNSRNDGRLVPCPECSAAISKALGIEAALSETQGWQPIETAPKDGTRILIWVEGRALIVHWQGPPHAPEDWPQGWRCTMFIHPDATYWMPLPAAPE